jgi:LuxR family maltose regulon positive regulatory protein
MMHAYLQAKLGNEELAMELLRLVEVAGKGGARLERDFTVIEALLHIYFDQFVNIARWPVARTTAEDIAIGDPLGHATLLCVGAAGALAWGRMEYATQASRTARAQMQLVASSLGEDYCLMHDALACAITGQLSRSRKLIDEALRLADANFGTDSALKALVGCFEAQHLYWQGLWTEAETWSNEGHESIEHTDGWLDVLAAAAEVWWQIGLWKNGLRHALTILDNTAQLARDRHLHRLSHLVQAWRVDLLSQCGLASQAQQEARAADLEVTSWARSEQGFDWRGREADTLALARMQLATGASSAALTRPEAGADAFQLVGLLLPAWRLRILALVAKHRAKEGEFVQDEVDAVLGAVAQRVLLGLLLEVGPSILPVIQKSDALFRSTVSIATTQLRGWQAHPARRRAQFSVKETQVLQLLASGQSNNVIARGFDISENTVKFHLKQIFQKLGVDNRAAVIGLALQQGLLSP